MYYFQIPDEILLKVRILNIKGSNLNLNVKVLKEGGLSCQEVL
jgi:hypothetical protein